MDETLTRCAIDLSNRPYLIWRVKFVRPTVGEMDTELFKEFHHAFAMHASACVHLETLYGENSHHIAESGFKALARALREAVEIDPKTGGTRAVNEGGVVTLKIFLPLLFGERSRDEAKLGGSGVTAPPRKAPMLARTSADDPHFSHARSTSRTLSLSHNGEGA